MMAEKKVSAAPSVKRVVNIKTRTNTNVISLFVFYF